MSTPSDPPPPASPMDLDSIEKEKQLVFLAQECRQALLDGDRKTADKFWNLLHPHLQEAFRALVKKFALNPSDRGDLHSVAVTAVWKKIESFDLAKAQNYKRPFTGWALDQGRYAIIENFQQTGLSKVMAHHKKVIIKKLMDKFPKGPEAGDTLLDLAREHEQELASPPDLTETMIRHVLAAWSLQEAEDIDTMSNIEDKAHSSTLRWLDIEAAMNHLGFDPRRKLFTRQRIRDGFEYAEIAKMYNQTQPPPPKVTKPDYAKKIVCDAVHELIKYFGD